MNTCIYILIDPRNNQVRYVGKSNNPKKRLQSHYYAYKPTPKLNWLLKLRKLGISPELLIVDEVPTDEWQFWETYWYDQIKSWGFTLYNSDLPGKGGTYLTMEQRKDRSNKRKGKDFIELYGEDKAKEIKQKIRNTKFARSDEQRLTTKNKRLLTFETTGIKDEWKRKISKTKTGSKLTDETKNKISETLKNSLVYKEGIKNRRNYDLDNNPNSKGSIYQYSKDKLNFIQEWNNLIELKDAGYNIFNISSVCNNKLKTTQGFYWTRIKIDF